MNLNCQQCGMEIFEGQGLYASADKTQWLCRPHFRKDNLDYAIKVATAEAKWRDLQRRLKESAKVDGEHTMQVEDLQDAWLSTAHPVDNKLK